MPTLSHLARQSFLGPDSDEHLDRARAAIIGLCGGGSPIAQQLAHVGVGHFDLFDDDYADDTNRNRMIGLAKRRVGEPKGEIIRDLIIAINPDARIRVIPKRWQEDPLSLKDCTVIFGCVDSFRAREEIEHYARRYMVPYIDVGMDVHGAAEAHTITGQVILSLPGHLCMRCMDFLNDAVLAQEGQKYGAAGGRPQVVWPNGTLASIAVGHFISLLTPWHKELMPPLYTEYDGNRMIVRPSLKLAVLKSHVCQHFVGPDAVGDVTW